MINVLTNNIPTTSAGKLGSGNVSSTVLQNLISTFSDLVENSTNTTTTKPKAHLNYVLLDEAQLAYIAEGSSCKQVGDDKVATLLSTTIEIPRNGYLYIYTSNETKNIDVYFDNLQLSHTRSPLLEENNCYAFGGDIKALCSKAMKGLAYINNNAKFNSGNEFNDDLDITLYETPFRNYNAQIGRFQGIDRLSELTPSLTPMNFGGNNPISFNDPSGLYHGGDLETVTVTGTIHRLSCTFLTYDGGSSWYGYNSSYSGGYDGGGYYGGDGSSGSASEPDGWVQDGSDYKYVDDKTVGVNNIEFIDPETGQTMHGDENGNLVAVPQELMDVVVGGTRSRSIWQRITDIVYQINKFNPIANIANGIWISATGHDSYGVQGNGWDATTHFLSAVPIGKVASLVEGAIINQTGEALFKAGYYEVNGFKFSEYYYNKLWNTGRGAPSLVAKELLQGAKNITPDAVKNGFYRYELGGWEMIYNPATKEVCHLMPIN